MTPLDKILKRSLIVGGVDYVLTLTPEALKLTRKGKRLGVELKWAEITSGDRALALALQASIGHVLPDRHIIAGTPSKRISAASPLARRTKRVSV